ncbi:trwc relaxase [Lucifera butyrica]|uniref:Trwc relaxase n=1 Tax=Lucifera butyrica TaxID=1351585 RepID=A0A498RB51_9FIRM|nr:MobF family relaxase [Lucifera butyrica]VBB08459.1 trwc relaxase [Lucifera butyrica]
MLSISNVGAQQAGSYYDKDGYYARMGDRDNSWYGKLKEDLKLTDTLEKQDFDRLINERKERAGFDLCFSAPKSVSIAMCMNDQTRQDMLEAHNKAVEAILAQIEQKEIGARVTSNKETAHIKTGNMICGRFNHYVSRASDPQLHTHCVILNKTKYNGKYYAVDNQSIYENKILYGQLYRNTLAREVMQKGYAVTTTDHEKGFFELAGISQKSMEHFSNRRAEIVQKLKEWDANSAQSAEKAALLTRQAKEHRDIGKLMESWKETLIELAESQLEKASEPILPTQEQFKAEFDKAINHISHRYFAVKEQFFKKAVLAFGVGLGMKEEEFRDLFRQEIGKEILHLGKRHNKKDPDEYYCTTKNYELEQEIFQEVAQGKNQVEGIAFPKAKEFLDKIAVAEDGTALLSRQQREAVLFTASNKDRYCAIQGLAGTGKTHMLNYARQVFEAEGYEVKGACFTGKAAEGLQKDAHIPSKTIHSFLNQLEKEAGNRNPEEDYTKKQEWKLDGLKPGGKREVWIVDEASMVGNATLRPLMLAAKAKDAKVVFIGDKQQLLPVAVGNSFTNFIERHRIETVKIDDIIRQKKDGKETELLKSVKEAVLGDVYKSLKIIDKDIQVIEKRKDRMKAIVKEFTVLPQEERNKTVILTADNRDRKTLNDGVRRELKKMGQLLPGQFFQVVDGRGHTLNREFSVDDKIIFLQNDNNLGVRNGQVGFIKEMREDMLSVDSNGTTLDIDMNQYNKIDHGYAMTTHKAQGITEDRAIINLDSAQKQLNSRNSYYVDISRARHEVKLFTDDREKMETQISDFANRLTSDDFLIPKNTGPARSKNNIKEFCRETLRRMNQEITQLRANRKLEAGTKEFAKGQRRDSNSQPRGPYIGL